MGYTHYFEVHGWKSVQWQICWPLLIQDARLILEAADVLVGGPGNGAGEVTRPVVDIDEGIWINGVADDQHEDFVLGRKSRDGFCKTLMKPYDLVVACILLRAYMLAPVNVTVSSDGNWDQKEWLAARRLYESLWPGETVWCPWFDLNGNYHGPEEFLRTAEGMELTPEQWLRSLIEHQPYMAKGEAAEEKEPISDVSKITEAISSLQLEFPVPESPREALDTVSEIDLTAAKAWLSRCESDENHASCKAAAIEWSSFPGICFRLIDTERRCVIDADKDTPSFIALSYVWGGDQPKLTSETTALLMSEGGLDKVWPNLPTTIRDAITVCQKLDERYLWVDALCIMQDSVKDKKLQVLRMRQIYAAAKCTIAAVSATAAKEGLLPGSIPNVPECNSEAELDDLLQAVPWSTRAWCYQEKVLSHRMIYFFTTTGIYLHCQQGAFNCNGASLARRPSGCGGKFNQVGAMLPASSGEDLESYLSAVEYFSARKLSVKDDKINAFEGVLQRYQGVMDGQPSSFTYGLPICAFDQTFCWRAQRHNPKSRNDCFPSWSWLGWDDAVTFDRALVRHARTNQMIYGDNRGDGAYEESRKLRKPANASIILSQRSFGFPASNGGMFYNAPSRHVAASVADLRIAKDPIDMHASNGLYPIYPMKCSEQPADPPSATASKTMTLLELLSLPMPKINWMDDETAAAPSLPAKKQTSNDYDQDEHAAHGDCDARTAIGHIWLDKEWRDEQPDYCVMEFVALHGEKSEGGSEEEDGGSWTITMLMLLQRMAKKDSFWANERVQIMDCKLSEADWEKTGPELKDLNMV
ncbi:hypothetical protein jhhlp_008807 [Lomentospora prolificans]|uniref:Heterokaryon incompatibility domain-containing protein n=1 Tax=Lomentospora prolificans TaxID=41688 RepID=A0A2N3MZ23_9PEZI|nr:hypothetical protein jhhlp_008807 [Lomentospora prolificans]